MNICSDAECESYIFLTPGEAIEAVCIDFEQYGPQGGLWTAVASMLGAPQACFDSQFADGGMRSLFVEHVPDRAKLCTICKAVFWGDAKIVEPPGEPLQIRIATQMRDFHCIRCGKCCRTLDYHRECSPEDVLRWQQAGRDDILEWVHPCKNGAYRIWVRPGTGIFAEVCPWLTDTDGLWTCSIHDLKPEVCCDYPGTRKHACMTGCPTVISAVESDF